MDTNEFITRLVEALAWPIATLLIALLLRKPIISLLKNLEKIKWQGTELEFGKQLVNAEKGAREVNLPSAEKVKLPAFKPDMSLYERMKSIAEISPAAAVADTWKAVEFATMEVAKAQSYDVSGNIAGYKIVEKLVADGILDQGTLSLYRDLRGLRNSAAHHSDFSISVNEALRYIDLSLSLANRLQEIANLKKPTKSKRNSKYT
ncbi:MAG: hypothetical protein V9G12_06760 [Microthrixaceae bacterium]